MDYKEVIGPLNNNKTPWLIIIPLREIKQNILNWFCILLSSNSTNHTSV
jgi:hypothetical protein